MTTTAVKYYKGEEGQRPWGSWHVLETGEGFIVKKIIVNAGEILSLQRHQHRSEHWVIVAGEADVTIGETTTRGTVNESFYIPVTSWHRIANPGAQQLVFIEVQTGTILDENDIERSNDKYGRVSS